MTSSTVGFVGDFRILATRFNVVYPIPLNNDQCTTRSQITFILLYDKGTWHMDELQYITYCMRPLT